VKLERARKHLAALDMEVRTFLASTPYVVQTMRDPATKRLHYFVGSVREPQVDLPLTASDVLHNLRASLDHLAWQLVLAASGTPTKDTCFPIFDSDSKYKSGVSPKVKGMSKASIKAIDELKPYKGGNDLLWQLHRLENVDKHRVLITVGSAFRAVDMSSILTRGLAAAAAGKGLGMPADLKIPPVFLRPEDRSFPLKAGVDLFVDVPGAEPDSKVQFTFEVALGEPGIVEGAPLLETLQRMTQMVEALLAQFSPML
jgi:hypothetical protein